MTKRIIISEKQYRRLFEDDKSVSYDNPLSIDMRSDNINEGLIRTYPFKTMMKYVSNYFNIPSFYMHHYINNGIDCIAIDLPKNNILQKEVNKAMNLCGYFESIRMSLDDLDRIHFEPKFEENEEDAGNVLYHVTHHSNIEKIKKRGLCPYSKNSMFNYPSRIYLFKSDAPDDVFEKMANALNMYSNKEFKDGIYAKLKIDVDLLPDNIRFYRDPNMEHALYITDNIPPDCISDELSIISVKKV